VSETGDGDALGRVEGPQDALGRVEGPQHALGGIEGPGRVEGPQASAAARQRLFVALELPEPVRVALIDWQRSVLADRPALRAVGAAGLHATLCFLGSRPGTDLQPIIAACAEVGERDLPPRLELGEVLWLPVRRPRVLAVALRDADHGLADVQATLSQALVEACGYEPEARAFRPHVTLARVRGRERVIAEPLPPPPALSFDADTVTLYRSHLRAGGARYEPLLSVELGRPQAR
jgi:2'-5' RNA ligase